MNTATIREVVWKKCSASDDWLFAKSFIARHPLPENALDSRLIEASAERIEKWCTYFLEVSEGSDSVSDEDWYSVQKYLQQLESDADFRRAEGQREALRVFTEFDWETHIESQSWCE